MIYCDTCGEYHIVHCCPVQEYREALAAKADKWVHACGGRERPELIRGVSWLYVWNPAKELHGWLNIHTDIVHNVHPNETMEERKVLS